jgi:hypothetical protein
MSTVLNDRDVLLQGGTRNVDPSAGKALLLVPDTNAFHVTAGGVGSPGSINLLAQPLNIPGTATWSVTAGGTLTGSGNSRSLAFSTMSAASVTVTAQIVYDGITYSKSQIITKVVDGATGVAGDKTATIYLYQWAASRPPAPTGTSTYTWVTGVNSAYSVADGWSLTVPGNPGTPGLQLFTAAKTLTVASSVTTSSLAYSTATIASVAMNGAIGPQGIPGIKSATARAYQWALSAPTASGSATWTWATASYNTAPVTGWSMTKPDAPGQGFTLYEATVQLVDGAGVATSAINWATAARAAVSYVGVDGAIGASAISATLSNQAHTMPTAVDGSAGNYAGCASTMSIYSGATDDSAAWSVAATPGAGVTGSLAGKTYTVTALANDTGYVDLVASRSGYASITQRFVISKSKTGAIGMNGVNATAYWLTRSAGAIAKSLAGAYTPNVLTVSGYSATGSGAPAAYAGRFVIATTDDGTTFTDRYTSVANESSKAYSPPAGIKAVRVRMYQAGGVTALLDEELVPVVSDGSTGATGSSVQIGYSLVNGSSLALTPPTATTAGTAYPALVNGVGPWGETAAWQSTSPAPAAGQTVFQIVGIYNGTNTVWGVPYMSQFKVGSLSAHSADLGVITAGDVHGAAFHTGAFSAAATWPAAGAGGGTYMGPDGILVGSYHDGKYLKIRADGNMYGPQFSIEEGVATFSGKVSAATITGGTISGTTISGVTVTGAMINGGFIDVNNIRGNNVITPFFAVNESLSWSVANVSIGGPLHGYSYRMRADVGAGVQELVYIGLSGGVFRAVFGGLSAGTYGGLTGQGYLSQGLIGHSVRTYGVEATTDNNSSYDFYAAGAGINYGPFTGGHDGLAPRDLEPEQGDILVDVEIAHHGNVSNTIALNALSSEPTQKSVIGVFVGQRSLNPDDPPAALKGVVGLAFMAEIYKSITLNAVGEGQINVCGEGGDIEAGDYITTSSMPGKGMRQADDLLHNYTVAKARESITFIDPAEIKMIACTYHCG